MSLYQTDDTRYDALLAQANQQSSMRCKEPMVQRALAQLCAEHDFWAYPCTQTETSCSSAVEALAAGLYPLTTDRGALAETLGGFGMQIAAEGPDLAGRSGTGARERVALGNADRDGWLRQHLAASYADAARMDVGTSRTRVDRALCALIA